MNKTFIKINNSRILKSTIKRYQANSETSIGIYYSITRYKVNMEIFKFSSTEERNSVLSNLDLLFLETEV